MNIPRPLLLAGTVILIFVLFGVCVTVTFALVRSRAPSAGSVSGQVISQEGVSLPEGAVVVVQVMDASVTDAVVIIGEHSVPGPAGFPVPYEVTYDLKAIDETHTYAAQAQVMDGAGNLLLMNKAVYPVITQDSPTTGVEIVVEPIAAQDMPTAGTVSGSVTYLEQFTLPANAQVSVQLVDVTVQDAPAQVIDIQTIPNPGQIPVPFNLVYDPIGIDQSHTYVVKAKIADGAGKVLFESKANYPVITQGGATSGVEVIVEPMGETQLPAAASLTGVLTYREKVALPSTAVAYVRLVDLSIGDTPAGLIGSQTIVSPGQVPIAFDVKYDPSKIDPAHLYSVKASIEDGSGNMLFVTTLNYPVITFGNPVSGIEVVLDRIYKGLQLCLPAEGVCPGTH